MVSVNKMVVCDISMVSRHCSVNVLCHILSFLLTHNTAVENLISTASLIRVLIVVDSETVLVVVIGLTSPVGVDVLILSVSSRCYLFTFH